jgi:ABC-type multidrug transport system fused ATPase/permease subunit
LLGPINQLANLTETLMSGHTALTKVFELLDEDNVELSNIGFESMAPIRGEVTFENVDFEYSDGTCALQGVSFATQPSRQIALVGESGAGKSTLIHLILGLYLPTAGKVLIDGRDITEMNLRNVRRQMGIVSQETILVNGTVRDNIRYGTPEASDEDVIAAAKVANAHEFISKLADGYEAQIGEDGVRLSGGQRQRLAIARAVLRNPCILILDEATSALDSESEYLVQQALERLSAGRTTFVIAHRLSTILNSDEIFAMKQGRVVERGTHQELLVKHGEYARLYHTQFQRALQLNAALTQQLESQPSRPIA